MVLSAFTHSGPNPNIHLYLNMSSRFGDSLRFTLEEITLFEQVGLLVEDTPYVLTGRMCVRKT